MAAVMAMVCAADMARAGIPWHADLAQAKAASLISRRPVLAIFTAQWSEASLNLEKTSLGSEDAVALVTACFEPVRIDVDADPETTRRMGVSYLPTACVVDADDRVLAKFDCPGSSSGFVAAAGRAAQDSAVAGMTVTGEQQARYATAPSPAVGTGHSHFSQPPTPAATEADATSLPATPPAWSPEQTSTPVQTTAASPPAAAARAGHASADQTIEPGTAQPAAPAAPWLDAQGRTGTPSTASAAPSGSGGDASNGASTGNATAPTEQPKPEKASATTAFLSTLQKPFSLFSKPVSTAEPAAPSGATTAAAGAPAASGQAGATAAAESPAGSMPVGLEGYCPVTLADRGKWVEGRAQWGVRHRGRTYLFAGPDQQKAFLADPDRYAPALSGDDPVAALDSGRTVAGQRRYGVTYQSRMYLFSSPESRTAFAANPQRYTARVLLAEQPAAAGDTVVR